MWTCLDFHILHNVLYVLCTQLDVIIDKDGAISKDGGYLVNNS
jgi:hypothetical protein